MATNLNEYYYEQGKELPSVQERKPIAESAGIKNYTGSYNQNVELLSYLKNQTGKIENPTPASYIQPTSSYNLPEPETPMVQESYFKSLSDNLASLKELDKSRLAEIEKQKEIDQKAKDDALQKLDPTQRATYGQEQAIIQNQLKAAQTASATMEADFNKRRQMTSELEGLLNRQNAIAQREAGLPVGQRVVSARTSNAQNDIAARTGVIQAVFSALDGNISQAQSFISQAQEAVSQQWKDTQNYYGTILELSENRLLNLDKEEREIAQKEMDMAEEDYRRSLETAEYIKNLMINPESAQFMADSGVKLTDSIEEINKKIAEQAIIKEVADIKNEMAKNGYEYIPFPTREQGLIPIQTAVGILYFKPPIKETTKQTQTEIKNEEIKIFSDFLKTGIAPSGDKFGNPMGEDGYVDPSVYLAAMDNWVGTRTDFVKNFPPAMYVNPASYKLLPEGMRPKTTTTSSSSDSSAILQWLNQ